MASYTIEVESFGIALSTGRLGVAVATYRGHEYRVPIGGGEDPSRDGHPCGLDMVPRSVYNFAVKQSEALIKAYRERAA